MKKLIIIFLGYIACFFLAGCIFLDTNSRDIKFHNQPCIKPHDRYNYLTCYPIRVTIDKSTVIVPASFDTDLASIPKWLWPVVAPSHSAFISSSILHDYLYGCHNGYNRKDIDYIFYVSLINNGVSKFEAYQMYLAVRMFGSNHFNNNNGCWSKKNKRKKSIQKCGQLASIKIKDEDEKNSSI